MKYESSKADKAKDKKLKIKEGSKRDTKIDVSGQKRVKPLGSVQAMKKHEDAPMKRLQVAMRNIAKSK